MAMIAPFRAWRYNPDRVRPGEVLTQPYDKITPAMQEHYHRASPWNLVRIELGRSQPGDSDASSVYTRAAASFRDWRQEGVLLQDAEPSLYVYAQRFPVPGGPERERSGLIALGRIEDYDAGVVFRHEQTHSGPKADRLHLLRATRAHFGQLFMLYSDPERALESRLKEAGELQTDTLDEYGVRHRLWRVSDPAAIEFARRTLAEKKLLIADGHHRYETAIAYRNQRRAECNGLKPDAPWELVMMTLVNMDSQDLVILPTHRVLFGLERFHTKDLLRGAGEWFEVSSAGGPLPAQQATALLAAAGSEGCALLAVTASGAFLLRAKFQAVDLALPRLSPRQRKLDVVLLHKLLIERVLGVKEEAVRELRNIAYLRQAEEAMARVRQGADVAFLMNPVTISQLREVAFAGEVMPQKSTDFYPKLLSGIAIYALD